MNRFLFFLFSFITTCGYSQDVGKWEDMFSFNDVVSVQQIDNKLLIASKTGLYTYEPDSGEIVKYTKVNGLHETGISAVAYDESEGRIIIGYESGNLDLLHVDNSVTYVVDIPLSQATVGRKRINAISISDGKAVITADYGISIFNLDKEEFGDTCFLPNSMKALSGGFYENRIYVSVNGSVYSITVSTTSEPSPDFMDFSKWQNEGLAATIVQGGKNKLLAASSSKIFQYDGGAFLSLPGSFANIVSMAVLDNNYVVTGKKAISLLDLSGNKIDELQAMTNTDFTSGWYMNQIVYGGTTTEGLLRKKATEDCSYGENCYDIILPDGPYKKVAYKLRIDNSRIWVSTGGRRSYNEPAVAGIGYYYYDGQKWNYPAYFKGCVTQGSTCTRNDASLNILDVMEDPQNPQYVYFTNYVMSGKQGVYKIDVENNEIEDRFIQNEGTNAYFRPSGLATYQGMLIASIAFVRNPTGNSQNALFFGKGGNFTHLYRTKQESGAERPIITDRTIWYGNGRQNVGGVVAFLYNGNKNDLSGAEIKYVSVEEGLADPSAIATSIDKFGDLWIGGLHGLRVLYDADDAIRSTNVQADPIIIEQNGLGEELFRDSEILAIAVDGANRKWISVGGGGVYYLSPDGQQTLAHFTAEDSPLPNNRVTDIQVDEASGKVYFATEDGIVVYKGDVKTVDQEFGEVEVYPNPVVYSQFKGNVTIRGLAETTNLRIVDAAGNLVHSAVARGGVYEWDLRNSRGARVASGVYFVLMTNADGTDKKAVKIAVINS